MVSGLTSVFVAGQVEIVAREVEVTSPLLQDIMMTTEKDIVDVISWCSVR